MACRACGAHAPTKYVAFYQNIGALALRFQRSAQGNLCKRCIHYYFWRFTTINVLFGWWGVISMIVTPIFILNNVGRYLSCLGMRTTPNGSAPLQATTAAYARVESSPPLRGAICFVAFGIGIGAVVVGRAADQGKNRVGNRSPSRTIAVAPGVDSKSPSASQPHRVVADSDHCAYLTVTVPSGAVVWIEGQRTTGTGPVRHLKSPPLRAGQSYQYEVRARWQRDGRVVDETRQVRVWAGAHVEIQFMRQSEAVALILLARLRAYLRGRPPGSGCGNRCSMLRNGRRQIGTLPISCSRPGEGHRRSRGRRMMICLLQPFLHSGRQAA